MSSRNASIRAEAVRAAAVLVELLLVVAGVCVLGAVYLTAMESGYTQMAARQEIYRTTTRVSRPVAVREVLPVRLAPDSVVGELSIPRLKLSTAALEGDTASTLRLGVGHLSDTPFPWQAGNSAFAGHRDTFFRALRSLREGDRIELATPRGTFTYAVRHLLIVQPDEVWVLDPALASLTLITCYPFTYVGSAPQRFVVQADRVGTLQAALTPAW